MGCQYGAILALTSLETSDLETPFFDQKRVFQVTCLNLPDHMNPYPSHSTANPGWQSRLCFKETRMDSWHGMVCYAVHGQQYQGDQHFDGTSTPWDMKIGNVWHKEI